MAESEERDLPHSKTIGDLGSELLRFALHTAIAVLVLILLVIGMQLLHTNPASLSAKYLATGLAFLLLALVGFAIARFRRDPVARYVWVAGLMFFVIVSVTVLDLPMGPGLCEHCGAVEKLSRTFFSFEHGSGLMGGDGPLLGLWMPLSMIGYAVGARIALDS